VNGNPICESDPVCPEALFCDTVTDVSSGECNALSDLYKTTGGKWNNHTNWMTDTTVGDWYGVTVKDGHVV